MREVVEAVKCAVRPARVADVPAMAGLLAELFAIETEFAVDRAKQERGLRILIERSSTGAWVAEAEGGEIVGMATAQTVISTAEGGESAWVEDVVVKQAWRGRGIGARLIDAVHTWCEGRGVLRMQLLADARNDTAMEFYSKKGWERTRMVAVRKKV